jgi:epoxyqueuosine reductase
VTGSSNGRWELGVGDWELRTLTSSEIKARARALGFDLCGIAPAGSFPELSFLREWLDRGHAGEMGYLQRTADKRADVRHVLPGARSVIVTGTIYNIARPYSTEQADPDAALISRYAWGDDYHDVLKARLDALVAWMRDASPEPFEARAYVDTGPVQERVYAQYAGLGWIGKNTCVINA